MGRNTMMAIFILLTLAVGTGIISAHDTNNSLTSLHVCINDTIGTFKDVGIDKSCKAGEIPDHISVGSHFSGDHADLTNVQADQHHAKYTDAEAVAAVGPHFGGDFSNLTGTANDAQIPDNITINNLTFQGTANTGVGNGALGSNTTGSNNTASGTLALQSNTTGSSNTASGTAALQSNTTGIGNTASGTLALQSNTTSSNNTASGLLALTANTTGFSNTASGTAALQANTTGSGNTAIGAGADVSTGNLTNATAIGFSAVVNASNKIRLGNSSIIVIEGQVAYTFTSDVNQKENFLPVDAEQTLEKISKLPLTSWNYKGHDPQEFRHYGPMAQDFFAAFGDDGFGSVGTDTTINSGDMAGIMLIAIQALEQRNAVLQQHSEDLEERLEALERILRVTPALLEKE